MEGFSDSRLDFNATFKDNRSFNHDSLESATGLPKGTFTDREMTRCLRRNRYNILASAKQLQEKHKFLKQLKSGGKLNIGDVYSEMKKDYIRLLPAKYGDCDCRPIVVFQKEKLNIVEAEEALFATAGKQGSTYGDALKTLVYTMEQVSSEMEELDKDVDGFVLLVDFKNCSAQDLATSSNWLKLVKQMLSLYPETLNRAFVLNASTIAKVVFSVAKSSLPEGTQKKIVFLPADPNKATETLLRQIPVKALPKPYGGRCKFKDSESFVAALCKEENIDLDSLQERNRQESSALMSRENFQLNGMQYTKYGIKRVLELGCKMKGVLYWRKGSEKSWFGLGSGGWKKLLAVLRDDVLLLFENVDSKTPTLIVSLLGSVKIRCAKFDSAPTGTHGFYVQQVGSPEYGFLAKSEQERIQWIQGIEMGRGNMENLKHERDLEDEYHARMNGDLLGLDDEDVKLAPPVPLLNTNTLDGILSMPSNPPLSQQQTQFQQMHPQQQQQIPPQQQQQQMQQPPVMNQGLPKMFPAGISSAQEYGQYWQQHASNEACIELYCNQQSPGCAWVSKAMASLGYQTVQILENTLELITAGRSAMDGSISLCHTKIHPNIGLVLTTRAASMSLAQNSVAIMASTMVNAANGKLTYSQ